MQNPFVQWGVIASGKVVVDEAGRHLGMVDAEALVGRQTQPIDSDEVDSHRQEKN